MSSRIRIQKIYFSSPAAYDVVLLLKPLQIPSVKHLDDVIGVNDNSHQVKSFPVVNYNPVKNFIEELRECFGSAANFYFCRNAHTVGIKFVGRSPEVAEDQEKVSAPNKPVFDPVLLVEDVKVLGRGLIKDVQINFSSQ